MEIESKQQILERRKEIEQELVDLLKETDPTSPKATERAGSNFTLKDIKDLIYNEEDSSDFHKLIAMFDGSTSLTTGRGACPPKPRRRRGDASELSNVLELVTDAWNYPGSGSLRLRYTGQAFRINPHTNALVWG